MRIAYVTQTRFPTEKAHGHQIAQVCDALASLGHEVTLIAPNVPTAITADPHQYYAVKQSFVVRHIRQFNALHSPFIPGALAFVVGMASYRRFLRREIRKNGAADLYYVRSSAVLSPLLATGKPVILELHTLPRWGRRRFVRQCNRCRVVVCLTSLMQAELARWGVDPKRLLTEGDGVDLSRFAVLPHNDDPRGMYNLPEGRAILGYAGSLVTHDSLEKGVGQVLEAAAELKKRGRPVFTWIIGGPRNWQQTYRYRANALNLTAEDICFSDPVPAGTVPSVLAAMDVCAYPAPVSDHPFFLRDTSPLKLLEYFAAQRPVVCADIPPVHDLCDEKSVWFCKPGDGRSMADAICAVLDDAKNAQCKVAAATKALQGRGWGKRMERILRACQA